MTRKANSNKIPFLSHLKNKQENKENIIPEKLEEYLPNEPKIKLDCKSIGSKKW